MMGWVRDEAGKTGAGRTFLFPLLCIFFFFDYAAVRASDIDGNGIDDDAEVALAEKFRPTLILPSDGTDGMKPCPVGILGDGTALTADRLWARVYNVAGRLVGVFRATDPDWNPAPTFASPSFNYSGFGWDGNAITYVGAPPGAAYYIYYVRLYPDYGGPSVRCPGDWRALYASGSGDHPPGADLEPTVYAHLLAGAGQPIIQYWFFFPFNDWVNNHEGDWEHVHIRVSSADPGSAEILSACFYFHGRHQIREASSLLLADGGHPVVWIGGSGEWSCGGCDGNSCPGDGNGGPESHGCYPFHGHWPDVGAGVPGCGKADEWVARCGDVVHWADIRVTILPEPDRIDYADEPGLSWHKAKIPFGTPFVPSYCDGACEFFDEFPPTGWLISECGNRAPFGPAHHPSWEGFDLSDGGGAYAGGPLPEGRPTTLLVPEEFDGIRSAALCALPGDTILVGPGTYSGKVLLTGGVTVFSTEGADSTEWMAPFLDRAVRVRNNARNVRIGAPGRGFHFTCDSAFFPFYYVVLAGDDGMVLAGNRFEHPSLLSAVYVSGDPGQVRIESNTFLGNNPAILAHLGPGREMTVGGGRDRANDFTYVSTMKHIKIYCDSCPAADGAYNYWGTIDPGAIASRIDDPVGALAWEPWTDSSHTGVYDRENVGLPGRSERVESLRLEAAEPNPSSTSIRVRFTLPRAAPVTLALYDVRGRRVRAIEIEERRAGACSRIMRVDDLPSGVYFLRITSGERSVTGKVILLR
ncbi:MAG: T9SS type A sorting domain-containing protein [Candidatus Eisenbacteria bacterium]|nr:T9SS type A sorting domain-containing protein [Candidatus Eisenbacteria bacterium]